MITNIKQIKLKSKGHSMQPLFYENDLLFYLKVQYYKIAVNDLILVKKNNNFFTHRVIYKSYKYLITKGDNNFLSDAKIYPKQIIGKVYQVKRNGQVFDPENLYLLQSTLYFQEIVKIKRSFEKEKINFVFLKGLPLRLYYEKTYPRRIYLDCDVLVDKKNYLEAEKILIKDGYQKAYLYWSKKVKKLHKKEIEATFYKKQSELIIAFDIHLQLVDLSIVHLGHFDDLYPQKLIDQLTADLLKTKRKVRINPDLIGVNNEFFFILNTKYLILYLALHIFHHNFRGAFRFQFLDKVIRKEIFRVSRLRSGNPFRLAVTTNLTTSRYRPLNRQTLNELITKYRLQNFVYLVFVLLKKYYKTPLPNSFLKSIQPSGFMNFMDFIDFKNLSIFDDEPRIKAGITRFKNLFFLSPRRWQNKVLIFVNPLVVYSILWVLIKKLFSSSRIVCKLLKNLFPFIYPKKSQLN